MKNIFVVLVVTILISGCATQTFTLNGGSAVEPDVEKMQAFFIDGLGQQKEINAVAVCGGADKVAKVESKLKFIDGFLGGISFGIYTPRTAKVYCIK